MLARDPRRKEDALGEGVGCWLYYVWSGRARLGDVIRLGSAPKGRRLKAERQVADTWRRSTRRLRLGKAALDTRRDGWSWRGVLMLLLSRRWWGEAQLQQGEGEAPATYATQASQMVLALSCQRRSRWGATFRRQYHVIAATRQRKTCALF